MQRDAVDLGVEVSSQSSLQSRAARLTAAGSLVALDGHAFASRKVQGAYALVEVRGYPDVNVWVHGSPRTRTNDKGIALVSGLLPFQANAIRLDANDVPLSAELDNLELTAVPVWRGATAVRFAVRTGRAAVLRFAFADGEPVPAGAQVERDGDEKIFFTARRGEAFVTGLETHNRVRLRWADGFCEVAVTLPPVKLDELPRLGPFVCARSAP